MMRSLFSGVSGLKGHQTRMDVIGNNIANVNTTGFKSSRVTFADTLSQTQTGASAPGDNLGGTNPKQIGLGAGVASIDLLFTDGSIQSTGKNTDLCLSGNGLFIVKQGKDTYYTRDGAFEFDAQGNYVLPGNGMYVQGWVADDNGKLPDSKTDGNMKNIVVQTGKGMEPKATTTATYVNNLNASTPIITKVNGYDADSWQCSANTPCDLQLCDETGTISTVVAGTNGVIYAPGDVYSSSSVNYSTAGDMVTVNKFHSPVTVTLANGNTHSFDYTSTDPDWKYGYTTTTAGDSAKATSSVSVTLKNNTSNRTASGDVNTTYTVGGTATTSFSTSGTTVTRGTGETLVLHLQDGTTHDVTNSPQASYVLGSDTYTYNGRTSTVIGAEVSFTVDEMTVISDEGDGASLRVGSNVNDGYALQYVTDGSSVTPSASNVVTLTLDDNSTISGLVAGGPYKVGDGYTSTYNRTVGDSVTPGKVRFELLDANGNITYFDDEVPTGNTYTVGSTFTYTANGNTVQATINGFAPLNTIKAIAIQSQITGISDTENTLVEKIIPGSVTASNTNALNLTFSDGTTQTVTSGTYNIGNSLPLTTIINVYDSLGVVHMVPVYFTKTATGSGETTRDGNQWTINVDGSNVAGTTSSIKEDDGSTTTVTMDPTVLQFSTAGELLQGSGAIAFTITDGANRSQTVALSVADLTQYASGNTIKADTDGNESGTLKSVSIDSSGVITGTYTNGIKRTEAQVAIAQFSNASGLTKTGSSLYQTSNNSGTANVKAATDLGVTITPSALEMSNVDIANEFSDMIITQRGFQSNSKIITVGDEMLETLINMKR